MTTPMTEQQFAAALDALTYPELHDALLAVAAYERGTDEWICEYQGEYEEEHDEPFEEDDAYWKAYDAFCEELAPDVIEQCGTTEDHFGLLLQALSSDWQQITGLMANAGNRDEILKHFPSL